MRPAVLFVDDEPRILDGLRRGLRDLRHDWDLRFALGGAEAVDVLDDSLTVVVSDMRMPGLDGVDVLAAARDRAPQAARVILSGNSDRAAALRAVGLAHRFLAKPCESTTLQALLPVLARCVQSPDVPAVGPLPVDPARVGRLRELLDAPGALDDVVAAVEQEPALVLVLLHAASSPFVVAGTACPDARAAVEHLGPPLVRELLDRPGLLDDAGPEPSPSPVAPGSPGSLAGLAPLLPAGALVPLLELWGLAPQVLAGVRETLVPDAVAVP